MDTYSYDITKHICQGPVSFNSLFDPFWLSVTSCGAVWTQLSSAFVLSLCCSVSGLIDLSGYTASSTPVTVKAWWSDGGLSESGIYRQIDLSLFPESLMLAFTNSMLQTP